MKTWLSGLAAIALGFCASLLLGDFQSYAAVLQFSEAVVVKVGTFILFPLAFFSIASGIASLRRRAGQLGKVFSANIAWSLLTSIIFSLAAGFSILVHPIGFPAVTSALGTAVDADALLEVTKSTALALNPFNYNPIVNTFTSSTWLLPIAVTAFLFGLACKGDDELTKPAYVVTSSISEVMFRLSHAAAKLGWVFLFLLSAKVFKTSMNINLASQLSFLAQIGIIFAAILIVMLPLLYAIFTGFKVNPYLHILRSLSPALLGLFSGNYLFSMTAAYATARSNLGVQKRVCGASLPLSSFITRAGSAMMATISLCCLCFSAHPASLDARLVLLIALTCVLSSLLCSLHLGYETLFISLVALKWLGIGLGGIESSLIVMLPIINGLGVFLDILISQLACSVEGCAIRSTYTVGWEQVI